MKKFLSMILAAAMCLSLCVPAFAAHIPGSGEANSNRYYYVYEYSNYTTLGTITVTEEEAQAKDTLKSLISSDLGTLFLYFVPPGVTQTYWNGVSYMTATQFFTWIYSKDPYARWGDYEISTRYRTKYRVDSLDGSRSVADKWVCTHYYLTQNGTFIDEYEFCVRYQ